MILLSSIINEFKDRFLEKYKRSILPSHKKALHAMQQCRQEHSPHMLAAVPTITAESRLISRTPAATEVALTVKTIKVGNELKIS